MCVRSSNCEQKATKEEATRAAAASATAMAAAEAVLRATVTSDAAATERQYAPPPMPTVGDFAYAAFKATWAKQAAEIEAAGQMRATAEAGVKVAMGEVTAPTPPSMARA